MDRRISIVSKVVLSVFMAVLLLFPFACEPGGYVTIQNQRSEDIKLFIAHVRDEGSVGDFSEFGTISAKTTKKISVTFIGPDWIVRFEFRDTFGKVVSSYDYKMSDLDKIDWKITIPPEQ